jgi:hypothetical protein
MTNAFRASVNFDAFMPNLLAQPRKPTAENSNQKWSSFQVAEQRMQREKAAFNQGVWLKNNIAGRHADRSGHGEKDRLQNGDLLSTL